MEKNPLPKELIKNANQERKNIVTLAFNIKANSTIRKTWGDSMIFYFILFIYINNNFLTFIFSVYHTL